VAFASEPTVACIILGAWYAFGAVFLGTGVYYAYRALFRKPGAKP
jgi:hypothetical protein